MAQYLHPDHLKLIEAYELKEDVEVADLVYWQHGNKGKFTIKSVLRLMRNEADFIDDECCKLVWNAPVQQRKRALLWIACHDRLLGNLNRYKRHMTDDPKCYVCRADEESTMHILRDCPLAKVVWKCTGGPADISSFYTTPLKQWITDNINHQEGDDMPCWETYFCLSLWWIWRWRNNVVFGRSHENPIEFGAFLKVRYAEARRSIEGDKEGKARGHKT